jgi:hypothetical protein
MTNPRQQQITSISTTALYTATTTTTENMTRTIPSVPTDNIPSKVDLMNDSIMYNQNDNSDEAKTTTSSYQTEEEDGGYEDDVKSLYSDDPEEELQRLADLQTVGKRISIK